MTKTLTAARTLIAVQVALAVVASSLAGFGLVYLLVVTFDTATGGDRPDLVLPVLLIVVTVLLSFVLLGTLGRLRRDEPGSVRTICVTEALLAVTLGIFVARVGLDRPLVWAPPLLDLACCIGVLALVAASRSRDEATRASRLRPSARVSARLGR